jgi:hypothetical protein
VAVEAERRPFWTRGWEPFARGAWRRTGAVVIQNVCTAGFDLHLGFESGRPTFTYRWRPPARDRAAARILRSRFHLLARAVLMQYPVLWWAGASGRVPLHASACRTAAATPLLTCPSGVGRSTLILEELRGGGSATGDNLAVADEQTVWGLVEPLRVEGGGGRRMPHGRGELPPPRPIQARPDSLVVLQRGEAAGSSLLPWDPSNAARALGSSTYMAGELRRYWAFAATLAAGTGCGPPHPPVSTVASALAARLPCYRLVLGKRPRDRLSDLFALRDEQPICA